MIIQRFLLYGDPQTLAATETQSPTFSAANALIRRLISRSVPLSPHQMPLKSR